jgi:hypothetical protein
MSFPLTPITAFDGLTVPSRADPQNYAERGDAWNGAFQSFTDQANVLAGQVNTMAISAEDDANRAAASATTATSAAGVATSASGAVAFNAATNYAAGQGAISNVNQQAYRRKTAGVSATDPANDPTNWTRTIVSTGYEGVTGTGNVSLTAQSQGAQAITSTAYGQAIILPDARTCSRAAILHTIRNVGPFPYAIKDNTGGRLGWIPPRGTAIVGLAENSTQAGTWTVFGADPAAITAAVSWTATELGLYDFVTIDANRSLILLHSGTSLYGMMYDSSDGTMGSPTLIRSAGSTLYFAHAVLTAANQVLVCTCDSTTAFQAVVLSISAISITVNTAVTTTLSSSIGAAQDSNPSHGGLIALGSNFVVGYTKSNATSATRVITISGTTPTIGAEAGGVPAKINSMFAVSSTVGLVVGWDGVNHYGVPISVSGGSAVAGTQAVWASTQVIHAVRQWGSRYLTLCQGNVGLISVSGTTATVSTAAGNLANPSSGQLVEGQISSTKWFLLDQSLVVRILTDTSGALSVTTANMSWQSYITGGICLARISSDRVSLYGTSVYGVDGGAGTAAQHVSAEVVVSGATAIEGRTTVLSFESSQVAMAESSMRSGAVSAPAYSYSGLHLQGNLGSGIPLSPARAKYSGSPQILGRDATSAIIVGGLFAAKFEGSETGVSAVSIPSLQLNPGGKIGDGSNTQFNRRLNGLPLTSRRVLGQTGCYGAIRTYYVVESIA